MNDRAPVRDPAAVRARGTVAARQEHRAPEHVGVLDLHATAGNRAVTTLLSAGRGALPERVDTESLGSLLPQLEQRAPHRAVGVAAPLRARLETALGTTVHEVAVHTDPDAASLADRSGAQAVTVGRHVLVGPGRYAPHTSEGQSLLAHEVVHAVAQRSAPASSRGAASPAEEQAVDRAGSLAAAGIRTPVPRATSAVGRQGKDQPAPAVAKLYSYKAPDGATVQVTEQAYLAQRAQAAARLRGDQRQIIDYAGVSRGTHQQYLAENHAESFADIAARPSRLFGIAVNIRAGVVPPVISIWDPPVRLANDAAAALAAGDLDRAARLTGRAREALTSAQRQWNTFMNKSISGGEVLAGELETVRDVSFAIAIAAAAVLLAPVVAGGVAWAGATGLAATGLTALGTGAATGVVGFGLRGGAEVGGQASTGKVDVTKAAKTAAKHLPSDVATGLTAGAAPGLGKAAGLAKPGLGVASTLARNAAVHGGLAGATGVAETGIDTARAVALEGKTLEAATKENVVPGLERTGVGVAGAVLSSPLGPAGQGLAARGRPLLGAALSHTGGAVVAGGTTLATGGTTEEATTAALRAGIVSTALGAARPQPTPARPVTREELPAGKPVNDVEPAGPRPPRPVTRDELPEGGPANDRHPLLRPVEAAELPAAPVANTNADVVSMTGSGTMVTRSAPFLSPPVTASASGTRPPGPLTTAPPGPRPAPPLPARPKAPAGPPAPRTETAGEFEARGGVVRQVKPGAEPEGGVTAVPRRPQTELSDLGEGPLAGAVQETTPFRAGIKPPRERPERGQVRPPIPRGADAPRAELNRFREQFADPAMRQRQKDILELAKTDALEAGNQYGKLVAEDFPGGPEVAEAFTRQGRRMDMGTEHEFTIEGRSGRFGSGKLDQLWDDLADKRNVTLTVPRLSPAAADQLERLLAQARQVMGPDRVIVVRETRP